MFRSPSDAAASRRSLRGTHVSALWPLETTVDGPSEVPSTLPRWGGTATQSPHPWPRPSTTAAAAAPIAPVDPLLFDEHQNRPFQDEETTVPDTLQAPPPMQAFPVQDDLFPLSDEDHQVALNAQDLAALDDLESEHEDHSKQMRRPSVDERYLSPSAMAREMKQMDAVPSSPRPLRASTPPLITQWPSKINSQTAPSKSQQQPMISPIEPRKLTTTTSDINLDDPASPVAAVPNANKNHYPVYYDTVSTGALQQAKDEIEDLRSLNERLVNNIEQQRHLIDRLRQEKEQDLQQLQRDLELHFQRQFQEEVQQREQMQKEHVQTLQQMQAKFERKKQDHLLAVMRQVTAEKEQQLEALHREWEWQRQEHEHQLSQRNEQIIQLQVERENLIKENKNLMKEMKENEDSMNHQKLNLNRNFELEKEKFEKEKEKFEMEKSKFEMEKANFEKEKKKENKIYQHEIESKQHENQELMKQNQELRKRNEDFMQHNDELIKQINQLKQQNNQFIAELRHKLPPVMQDAACQCQEDDRLQEMHRLQRALEKSQSDLEKYHSRALLAVQRRDEKLKQLQEKCLQLEAPLTLNFLQERYKEHFHSFRLMIETEWQQKLQEMKTHSDQELERERGHYEQRLNQLRSSVEAEMRQLIQSPGRGANTNINNGAAAVNELEWERHLHSTKLAITEEYEMKLQKLQREHDQDLALSLQRLRQEHEQQQAKLKSHYDVTLKQLKSEFLVYEKRLKSRHERDRLQWESRQSRDKEEHQRQLDQLRSQLESTRLQFETLHSTHESLTVANESLKSQNESLLLQQETLRSEIQRSCDQVRRSTADKLKQHYLSTLRKLKEEMVSRQNALTQQHQSEWQRQRESLAAKWRAAYEAKLLQLKAHYKKRLVKMTGANAMHHTPLLNRRPFSAAAAMDDEDWPV